MTIDILKIDNSVLKDDYSNVILVPNRFNPDHPNCKIKRNARLASIDCPFVALGYKGEQIYVRTTTPNTSCEMCDVPETIARRKARSSNKKP